MRLLPGWQIEDRGSRHVRRARLSVKPNAPRHRLVASMEEALRLASLPGENEGRAYYFRRLRVTGLPDSGDRRAWLDAFERALSQAADAAVHAADPRADLAPAVFFRSRQEALEILLRRIVERSTTREWFWPMVARELEPSSRQPSAGTPVCGPQMIPAIVEALRSSPAAWVAVAAALFTPPRFDVVAMLQAIPIAVAEAWLAEMENPRLVPLHPAPRISRQAQHAVQQAVQVFGFDHARTVWITALAILHESPAEMAAGTVVARARIALRMFNAQVRPAGFDPLVPGEARSPGRPLEDSRRAPAPAGEHFLRLPGSTSPAASAGPSTLAGDESPAGPETAISPAAAGTPETPRALPWQMEGLATHAAGLFFLLNTLEHLGIAGALAAGLAAACPDFLPRLFFRLAGQAGAAGDDPIVVWLASRVNRETDDSPIPCEPSWGPSNLAISRAAAPVEHLLRVWVLGVRRWCWQAGKITVREIVTRRGRFSASRVDLDVSLPLDEADIRIRRVGLDLDPGWLPWFGRVVRFHYLYPGEFHG